MRATAAYVGMLRLGRMCAGGPGVLGARAALSRSWQEARSQAVRFLRYWPPAGREGAGQFPGRGTWRSCRASEAPPLDECTGGKVPAPHPPPTSTSAIGKVGLAWWTWQGALVGGCRDFEFWSKTLDSFSFMGTEGKECGL